MSRSKKKTSIAGIGNAKSEKDDKRLANRKLRRLTRVDPENPPALREVSDVWGMSKDGKRYFDPTKPGNEKWMRK
jgi:hypothetical protein